MGGRHGFLVHKYPQGVHARHRPGVPQLARAVAQLQQLARDRSGPGATANQRRQALAARHPVAVAVHAGHRQRECLSGHPPAVQRALHATLRVVHAPRLARGPERGGLRTQEQGHLERPCVFDYVGRLVGAVATVLDAPTQGIAPHAHGDADDGAPLEEPVPPRVPRLDENRRALASPGACQAGAREPAHRQTHLLRVHFAHQGRSHHRLTVDGGDNLVPAHLPPAHRSAVP
mmetsp:Transcript_29344/g.73257  ORF Transcript_29344/g.73257 Transcript_29344/m.73257 type:complete len:232 (-) Transcript_29344:1034-1729(-)